MLLLVKDKVNVTKLLISKSFIELREYNEMKEKIKNPETPVEYTI